MKHIISANLMPRDGLKGTKLDVNEQTDGTLHCKLVSWATGEILASDVMEPEAFGAWVLGKVDW